MLYTTFTLHDSGHLEDTKCPPRYYRTCYSACYSLQGRKKHGMREGGREDKKKKRKEEWRPMKGGSWAPGIRTQLAFGVSCAHARWEGSSSSWCSQECTYWIHGMEGVNARQSDGMNAAEHSGHAKRQLVTLLSNPSYLPRLFSADFFLHFFVSLLSFFLLIGDLSSASRNLSDACRKISAIRA